MTRSSSQKQVALLRAINVGSGRKVPMKDLKVLFEEHGARDVVTYIQSGNVVYTPPTPALDAETLGHAISERFGFSIPVVVRDHASLTATLADNPFLARGEDRKFAYVAFLSSKPSAVLAKKLDVPVRSPGDEAALSRSELYLHLPGGAGKSKVSAEWLDRTLGVVSTVRNWNTVEKLVALSARASAAVMPAGAPPRVRTGGG